MNNQEFSISPCVRNCCLNDDDVCLGCFRTLQEICQWSQADHETRLQVLRNAEQRRLDQPTRST